MRLEWLFWIMLTQCETQTAIFFFLPAQEERSLFIITASLCRRRSRQPHSSAWGHDVAKCRPSELRGAGLCGDLPVLTSCSFRLRLYEKKGRRSSQNAAPISVRFPVDLQDYIRSFIFFALRSSFPLIACGEKIQFERKCIRVEGVCS